MRAVLIVLIVAVAAVLIGLATGFFHIGTHRAGPQASATSNHATKTGQAFDVETGSVKVGTREAKVKVPVLEVEPANGATNETGTARSAK
jgi:hypothetical protein